MYNQLFLEVEYDIPNPLFFFLSLSAGIYIERVV